MDLIRHFQMLAAYNRVANERIFACCAELDEQARNEARKGSFGSISGLLNHVLLGDRIWMARFEGESLDTPPLNTVLFAEFPALRAARSQEDARIERFFQTLDAATLGRSLRYVNNQGKACVEESAVAMSHFFNHQTHHRGQLHVMLSQTAVAPPSLDLHRIVNP